jgi:hypothetical protein
VQGAVTVVLGLVLVALGATGATLAVRETGRPTPGRLVRLVPFGVLVGAGAALVRGWDLGATAALGAVLVPLVALLGDLRAARRRARGYPE